MNYRHLYHAGSFADVIKHTVLIALIDALSHKDTPFCCLDTHAGIGYYDLTSEDANKTKEYAGGIEKIIQALNPPPLISRYLHYIQTMNQPAGPSLRCYPGSPLIASHFSRPHDRIVACELHPQQYEALKAAVGGDKKIKAHHIDGYTGLKAFLPPAERRGIVLIDPPFENPDEFNRITHFLSIALKRWERGVYAVWYPLKEKAQIAHFYRTVSAVVKQTILAVELTIHADIGQHLNGCGLIIINPPWTFDKTMETLLPWLWNALTINQQGHYRCFFLNNC